ncbi:MAG: DinB family protein [Caldilinea sp. CFX5]|nr:DinB family protein [Caldilinea sp. CFX5]
MSQRAQELVQRFAAANNAMIQYIEGCSEADLNKVTSGEGWRVRVAAHHIGGSHEPVAGLAYLIATSAELPALTMEMFNQLNAQHAADYANVSKADVLAALQQGGAKAAGMVGGFSDEQLDRSAHVTAFGGVMSTQQVIENILIWHIDHHMASIKATVGK